jgi:hypothetical protein
MLRVKEYTHFAAGTKLENGGEIHTCPHCDRSALLEEVDGRKWFTHSETVGFDSKGNPTLKWETCPPPFSENSSRMKSV